LDGGGDVATAVGVITIKKIIPFSRGAVVVFVGLCGCVKGRCGCVKGGHVNLKEKLVVEKSGGVPASGLFLVPLGRPRLRFLNKSEFIWLLFGVSRGVRKRLFA